MENIHRLNWDKEQVFLVLCQFARQVDYGVIIIDPQHEFKIAYTNNVMTALTGYHADELVHANLSILYGPLTNEENIQSLEDSLTYAMVYKMAMYNYRKNGSAFWNELNCLPIRDHEGTVLYYYVICRNITNVIHTENVVTLEREVYAAIESGQTLELIFAKICDDIALTFKKGCHCSIFLFQDDKIQLAGYGKIPEQYAMIKEKYSIHYIVESDNFSHILKKQQLYKPFASYLKDPLSKQLVEQAGIRSFWTVPFIGQDGEMAGCFTLAFDSDIEPDASDEYYLERIGPIVLLALKYIEQKNEIRQLAYYDRHTKLPNYTLFQNIVKQSRLAGTLFIFEPSEFQNIIDVYGRDGGDELLKQLSARIHHLEGFKKVIVARYTSSALVKLLAGPPLTEAMLREHLYVLTAEPYTVKGKQVYITLKVGTSQLESYDQLHIAVQQADTALSAALKNVGTTVRTFNPTHIESTEEKMTVLANITKALMHNEFYPMLQPKVSIATGEIISFEALARWQSEELGFVSPAVFIPVAESIGSIHRIDRQILEKVLQWQQERQQAGEPLFQVSVNISPPHFYYPTFVEDITTLIASYGIDYRYIKFEITESIELENVMRAKTIILNLQQYGIETAIDDFGVGYSSLSYLQELPFDEIKIDKSFIDDLHNPRMTAVVKTLIQLATDLQMKVVAEGIETQEQHERLQQLGCAYGQGYYFFRPMKLADIDAFLQQSAAEVVDV